MVIPNNVVISYCGACQLEFAGQQGNPCPLCPYRDRREDAERKIRNSEPCRILERAGPYDLQTSINSLVALGWALADFRIAHVQNHGHGAPVYVAVLQRPDYDPERHRSAVDAENFMDSLSTRIRG